MASKFGAYRNYGKGGTGYRWIDKDPLCDALRQVWEQSHLNVSQAHEVSGLAAGTINNWFFGDTRRPQNASSTQFAAALGAVRRDVMDRNGRVTPAFVMVRDLDYAK